MKPMRYAVLAFAREWRVVSERKQIGHFATRAQAFELALRMAREARASGHDVELLYADLGSELNTLYIRHAEHDRPTDVRPANDYAVPLLTPSKEGGALA